ncbi:MAG: dienelactone hydrolase family protein, partial [Legionellales bacterium]
TVCRGFIAYDDSWVKPMPCVMIAHDWEGRSQSACNKAKEFVSMGYVGFTLDMYGQAQLGADKDERRALMMPLMQDRQKLMARMNAAFNLLTQLPQVDKGKIAAVGYCFGGLCVLDLARSGTDVKAVISFHGLLAAAEGALRTPFDAKVLVLHGYDDPLVPPKHVNEFAIEMTERKVDWQIHVYGRTAHAFTNPRANDDEMGLHYNALSERRSWATAQIFLNEVFGC